MTTPFLIGRILFGGYFLYNGINHFMNSDSLAGYARSKNVPMPEAAVAASGALLLLGGASTVLGYQPKVGAAALIAFLAGVSPAMHNFWTIEDPGQRASEMINFTKNMALIGAALTMLGVDVPWPAGVEGLVKRSDD